MHAPARPKSSYLLGALCLCAFLGGCITPGVRSAWNHFVLVICKVSPEQKVDAKRRVDAYFAQVENRQRPRPYKHYIAVQTLDPNPAQTQKYLKTRETEQKKAADAGKPLGPEWKEPNELHCIAVFDVETHEYVGGSCYVVSALPTVGQVTTFDTYSAEFIGN